MSPLLSLGGGMLVPPLLEQPERIAVTNSIMLASRITEPKTDFAIATLLLDNLRSLSGTEKGPATVERLSLRTSAEISKPTPLLSTSTHVCPQIGIGNISIGGAEILCSAS